VQRYLHDLTGEMGEQLDAITSSLAYFTEVGVPTIRLNQKHGAANLQNLSTVATFFSAGQCRYHLEVPDTYLPR
jgi:hypothetical protein